MIAFETAFGIFFVLEYYVISFLFQTPKALKVVFWSLDKGNT